MMPPSPSGWYAPNASSATAHHARTAGAADLDQRLDSALETIYFIFNEGTPRMKAGT